MYLTAGKPTRTKMGFQRGCAPLAESRGSASGRSGQRPAGFQRAAPFGGSGQPPGAGSLPTQNGRLSEVGQLQSIWYNFILNLRGSFNPVIDLVDILVVTLLIYAAITLVRQTHTAQLAKGIIAFLIASGVANLIGMRTVAWIINGVMSIGIILLVVVFQPELRRALEQVGSTRILGMQFFKSKAGNDGLRGQWQKAIVAVCDSAEQLAASRTGALMVLERGTNLSEIIKTGTVLNADITPEMLGTIFYVGTPLHDGAVVVRDGRIKAAGCFLPLSNNLEIGKDMGTRHRAALGISENSDAVVVVVSEETGIISLAKNGVLIRRLDRQNLFNMLEGDVVPPPPEEKKRSFWRRKHEKDQA